MKFSAKHLILTSAAGLALSSFTWAETSTETDNIDASPSIEVFPAEAQDEAQADNQEPTQTTNDSDESQKGKTTIEFTISEGDAENHEDDNLTVTIRREGRELTEEETEAELEEWEQEVMDSLDEAFRGNPRKGIFSLLQDRDGGFVELGFGMQSSDGLSMMREGYEGVQFATEFNIGVQVAGLFYEYFSDSGNRGLFGVNFFNSRWLGIDMIVGKEHKSFATDKEDTLLLPINVRKADWTGGVRSTLYLGPLVTQGQIRKEITNYHEGYTASVQSGASVQIMNLNLHALVGASYQSAEVMDYYYGVSAAEANANFAEYTPGEDLSYHAEVGASYPVGEHWVLRGQMNYEQRSNALINSPFWEGDDTEHLSNKLMLMLVL